jgi:acetoin utilization deacetylase AcuC-like enzyme
VRVGLYDDPLFREHDAGLSHPETPARLDAVRRGTRSLEDRLELVTPPLATIEQLRRVHTEPYIQRVSDSEGRTVRFDPDTQAGPRSYEAAVLAAGAVVDAVDRVLDGRLDRALCAVRPPGHHASPECAAGFCLFNNLAVGTAHALERGLQRVMVIDWDVHHGNGTQAAFFGESRVLYVSSHAYPWYPGTGRIGETGAGPGEGFTVNLPMPHGSGDAEYGRVYREIVEPIGRAFSPELVMVSAGFDTHADDPLAPMSLSERGVGELTDLCLRLAEGPGQGRAVVVLEGGYNLRAIERSSRELVRLLVGERHQPVEPSPAPYLDPLLAAYREAFGHLWPL